MGFFKTLFGGSDKAQGVPDELRNLAGEMKDHALEQFHDGKEPSVYDMKLYDGRVAIQCEYELSHLENYKSKPNKPEQLHVSISFPRSEPSKNDVDTIMLAFFDRTDGVRIEYGASGGVDVIHLKSTIL